jgi:hypothetical protein
MEGCIMRVISMCVALGLSMGCLSGAVAASCDPATEEQLFDTSRVNSDLEHNLYSLFQCKSDIPQGASEQNDVVACNWFVGEALATLWGHTEFFLTPAGRYMLTYEMAAMPPDGWSNFGWTHLGAANDQSALDTAEEEAHRGNAVIALGAGHVALILPGGLAKSGGWNLKVPRAAQLRINDIGSAFVGCRLSYSWPPDKIAQVQIYSAPALPKP